MKHLGKGFTLACWDGGRLWWRRKAPRRRHPRGAGGAQARPCGLVSQSEMSRSSAHWRSHHTASIRPSHGSER
jgi:hypothetical protein